MLWQWTACLAAAALLVPLLPFDPRWLLPVLALPLWRRRLPWVVWMFPLCLLVCTLRVRPGAGDLRRLLPPRAHAIDLEFVVVGDAVPATTTRGEEQIRVPAMARAIRYVPEWQSAQGRIQLRLLGDPPPGLLPGSRWRAHGRLEPGETPHTGLRRAAWWFTVAATDLEPLSGRGGDPLIREFFRVREFLAQRLHEACGDDAEAAEVLQILLLARRGELDERWMRLFARTGMMHLFAVSGLHLGLLGGLLLLVFRRLGVGHRWRWAVVLPALFLFTACTGFRASALRALIMAGCMLIAPLLYRRKHPPSALAAAASLILLLAPEQIRDPGFLYSFLLVGGLLLAGKVLERWVGDWIRGDPWAPPAVQHASWKRWILHPLLGGAGVSLLCFLVSTPLTAHLFNLFSPIALPANLVAVPLTFVLLACGFCALPFLTWTGIGPLALAPARLAARALLDGVAILERVPFGVHVVRSPPIWMVAAAYALPLLAVLRPRLRTPCLGLLLALAAYAATDAFLHHRRQEAVVIDADRGQSAWFRNARGDVLLVDVGSDWSGWNVREALRREGIDRVDALILTHADSRHVSGLTHLLREYQPRVIHVPATDIGHPLFADRDVRPLSRGDVLHLAGWRVAVLWPPAQLRARSADERSLVLDIHDGFASVRVMGGADERVEARLLAYGDLPPARLLLAGHSQGKPGCTPEFLQATQPSAVVFSGTAYGGESAIRAESEARATAAGFSVWRVPRGGLLRLNLRQGSARTEK